MRPDAERETAASLEASLASWPRCAREIDSRRPILRNDRSLRATNVGPRIIRGIAGRDTTAAGGGS